MTTCAIIPTKHRPDLLHRCLNTLFDSGEMPDLVIVVIDNCKKTLEKIPYYPVIYIVNTITQGFWGSLRKAINYLDDDDLFFYFGQDVIFMPDWYKYAMDCYRENFVGGMGVMALRDDIQNYGNASHGATTKKTFFVAWGHPYPPPEYEHHFCDSELTVRCRDLGLFFYEPRSYVKHLHAPVLKDFGGQSGHNMNDYETKEERHKEWVAFELDNAKKRMREQLW